MVNDKRQSGSFYTVGNPFFHVAFKEWSILSNLKNEIVLEPFAGSNNLISMLASLGFLGRYASFDKAPTAIDVSFKDTIENYPKGFKVAITNPPFLAKNSAKRFGMNFPETSRDDLYKHCLDLMMSNNDYIAAITPDSILTTPEFKERALDHITLNYKMFSDTDHPVCLSLFGPEGRKGGPRCWVGDELVGSYEDILKIIPDPNVRRRWKFNDPSGFVGLIALDNTRGPSIRFCMGDEIDQAVVKSSSRALTRISLNGLEDKQVEGLVRASNFILNDIRNKSKDVLLTSFKGMRKDGVYRKRLDYKTARIILDVAFESLI